MKNFENQYNLISVSHFFYPRVGGLENMAYTVVKYLSQKGFKSIAIYGNDRNLKNRADGFDWVSFRCLKIFNKTYPIFGLKFFSFVFKTIKNNPKAVVLIYDRHLTSSIITATICKILRHPYVLVAQTTTSNYFKSKFLEAIANGLDKFVFKKVLSGAETIISVSDANKEFLVENFNIDELKIDVIYNVFNEDNIKEFEIKQKQKIVVFATKFIPVKDPNTTAKAFLNLAEKFPSWKFVYAGKGETILQDFENIPSNIDFIPRFLPQVDLFHLLSKSSIYVNSSLNEGLSLGVIEAASLGNLTVLSDAPSNLEVASTLGLKRFSFERTNVLDLQQKLEKAILRIEEDNSSEFLYKISQKAFSKFSSKKILNKYYKLTKSLDLRYNKIENDHDNNLNLNLINEEVF